MTGREVAVSRRTPAERLYRVAFHAYPRRWRSRHRAEALAVLLERADHRSGRVSWADGVDLIGHGLTERGLGVVRGLRRLTPLAKVGLTLALAAAVAVGVEVYVDAVRGPTQSQVQAALPATAQLNTTRCPDHPPALPDLAHSTETVVHVLNHSLEPLDANRLLICRWTRNRSGDLVLTGQRVVTDQATITTARDALNSLRHSWWFNLRGWGRGGGGGRGPAAAVTNPVFGTDRTVPHLLTSAPKTPR